MKRRFALGFVALTILAVWALAFLLADILHFRAASWVEAWSFQAESARRQGHVFRPEVADWEEARRFGLWASRLSPFSPDYEETLARVYEYRDLGLPGSAPAARQSRQEALRLYRQAAQRRPSWPYVQASIAGVKARLGERDAEFEQALVAAARLGPWEPQVMLAIVDIGLSAWPELSASGRQVVIDAVLRSQSWQNGPREQAAKAVWAPVAQHRKQAVMCAWMSRQADFYQDLCNPQHWFQDQAVSAPPTP